MTHQVRPASDRADVLRLQALRALHDLELDLLAFRERAEPLRLDGGVVAEDVSAAVVLGDEAEALRIIEPLHGTGDHCSSFAEPGELFVRTLDLHWRGNGPFNRSGNGKQI